MAKFSDRYLKSLKPKDKKYQVRDTKGFALQVLPSGTKTFLFIYERDGKRRQHHLGVYEEEVSLETARHRYHEAVKALGRGEPFPTLGNESEATADTSGVMTVKELIDKYLAYCVRNGQSPRTLVYKKLAIKNYLSDWFARDCTSITRTEAARLIEDSQTETTSGKLLFKVVRSIFEYAVAADLIPYSPFTKISKVVANLENSYRTRALSEQEISDFWYGLDGRRISDPIKRALKLVLVTAQRPGEVAGIHRREIDGDWWIIPPERNLKAERYHRVYLTPTAKQLLGEGEGYLLTPVRSGKDCITTIAMAQAVRNADYFGLPKWTPHDLRRTARTHMSRIRVRREDAEAVMNHAKQGMVQVYDQYEYDDEKKEALLKWEQELLSVLKRPPE